jgi:hypothetical protein
LGTPIARSGAMAKTRRERGVVVAVRHGDIKVTAKNRRHPGTSRRDPKATLPFRGHAVRSASLPTDAKPTWAEDLKQTGKPDDARRKARRVARATESSAVRRAGPLVKDVPRHFAH